MMSLILILIPLVAGLLILALSPKAARIMAILAALIEFAVAACIPFRPETTWESLTTTDLSWIDRLNARFHLAIDGISLVLVLLTAFLVPLIMGSIPAAQDRQKPSAFYSLILIMEMALIGVFTARDAFLFYIFWELALIPIYFICLRWGGPNRGVITLKFFIYTMTGSLVMLLAFIYIYTHTPLPHSFGIEVMYSTARSLPVATQELVFCALFFAFAVKMPVFPFHSWQPETYHVAPSQGTMLLSGIMLKMGTYGVLRWLLPMTPLGFTPWITVAMILCLVGIIYASLVAWVQKDLKKLLAYSSIAHVALICAGMLTLSKSGIQGALIQMVSHGLIVVALFYIVDIIHSRADSQDMDQLGGIRVQAPGLAAVFMIVLLGNIALPLTSGFIGEFLLISSVFVWSPWYGVIAGLSMILGAVYMLQGYQKTMLGEGPENAPVFPDLTGREKVILFTLVLMVLVLGLFPSLVLKISEGSVDELIQLFLSKSN